VIKLSEEKMVFKVNGIMKSPGNLVCDDVDVNGILKVDGDLNTGELNGNGMIKITGDIKAVTIKMNGTLKVLGNIDVKSLNMGGIIKSNSINSENIIMSGKLNVEENINCDIFDLKFDGNSSVENIEGSKVKVEHKKIIKHQFKVNTISADEIDIEYVTCDTISGDIVKVGKGCKVENITYITSLEIDPHAKVKNSQKAV